MTTKVLICSLLVSQALCWEALPPIPSGRRSQFLVLNEDGGYKYGYDTGDGSAAKQSADQSNQVSGHYFYKNAAGQNIDLKYTSGVQGFVPEGLEKFQAAPGIPPSLPITKYSGLDSEDTVDDQTGTGDASYSFNIDTDTYKRMESSDPRGNVQGSYSYNNEAGVHDLSYVAGEGTGFVATSGSLSRANGLKPEQLQPYSAINPSNLIKSYSAPLSMVNNINTDGSYAFSYDTGDSSRQESADAANNVQGRYSFQNKDGSHDLSYVAGSSTGFQVTGGSLSKPSPPLTPETYIAQPYSSHENTPGDSSYKFKIDTDDYKRTEQADADGNVSGSYSYKNSAGSHDLSFVAGAKTGFLPTGGSLSNSELIAKLTSPFSNEVSSPDSGVVLAKIGSDETANDDQSNTGDSSYSFNIDTDDYKRSEVSDASGNVKGSFSYKNEAGNHELSYVAGSSTGFVATGGSLSDPNLITAKIAALPYAKQPEGEPAQSTSFRSGIKPESSGDASSFRSGIEGETSGDASYSFSIDTDEYKRHETSDASGNIQGSYSYKNAVGSHDLNFVAGSATGFLPTGGSLSVPPGLTEPQLRMGVSMPLLHSTRAGWVPVVNPVPLVKSSYSDDRNAIVHSYLPPSNDKKKFGYIYDTA